MSTVTGVTQIRVEVTGDRPLVVETETPSDDVMSVLADEHRRQVLAVISGESAPMDLSTLVERVDDRVSSDGSEVSSDRATNALRITLHHQHLPKMASAGLVEYDTESQTVEATRAIQA